MSFNVGGLRLEQPFRIKRIGHFGYLTPDLKGTIAFLTDTLGLSVSDVEDFSAAVPSLAPEHAKGYFLRCNTDHHTMVIGAQEFLDAREPHRAGFVVGQVSWQVGSLKQVVDGVAFLNDNARIRRVGRDAPGSNWHAYAYDPDGYVNEVFYGMEQVGWDGYSKPRSMYGRAFHELPPLPQIAEEREVHDALAGGDGLRGFRTEADGSGAFDVEGVLLPRPFKITRLGWIGLFVADLDASVDYYVRVMGLRLTERIPVEGGEAAFLRADDEHHTLALYPRSLGERLGVAALVGFPVASYQQLKDAHGFLEERDVPAPDLPPSLSPGVLHGFWAQGPDRVAVQLYHGMAKAGHASGETAGPDEWPDVIAPDEAGRYEPAFYGPLG